MPKNTAFSAFWALGIRKMWVLVRPYGTPFADNGITALPVNRLLFPIGPRRVTFIGEFVMIGCPIVAE